MHKKLIVKYFTSSDQLKISTTTDFLNYKVLLQNLHCIAKRRLLFKVILTKSSKDKHRL